MDMDIIQLPFLNKTAIPIHSFFKIINRGTPEKPLSLASLFERLHDVMVFTKRSEISSIFA